MLMLWRPPSVIIFKYLPRALYIKSLRNINQVLDERFQDNWSCGYEIGIKMFDTEDCKRGFKFLIQEVEFLFYLYSENNR